MKHTDIPEGHMTVCPDCMGPNITRRQPQKPNGRASSHGKEWWCRDCNEPFDERATRERRDDDTGEPRGGLARRLLDADPDEVGP